MIGISGSLSMPWICLSVEATGASAWEFKLLVESILKVLKPFFAHAEVVRHNIFVFKYFVNKLFGSDLSVSKNCTEKKWTLAYFI